MDLDSIRALVADDMAAVDKVIDQRLETEVALVKQVAQHIIHSGGKRLRPLLVLLSAQACGYQGRDHIDLAAVIEFIHTATLLHDDVVDASTLRRGNDTANAVWGNPASVLVGDFLYSRAFQMMVDVGRMKVMEILADTTNLIAEGEVMQLINCHDPDTTEQRYRRVIYCKTAKLFETAARLGAVLASLAPDAELALTHYGAHLGMVYQLVDDVLDYRTPSEQLGKNIGDDLAEGKPTLPLIHAMRAGSPSEVELIREAIRQGGLENMTAVVDAIESTGAITYTVRGAREEAERAIEALSGLPESPAKEALCGLVEFSLARTY